MSNRANQAAAYPTPASLEPVRPKRPALRGFYARRFRRSEISDLEGAAFTGLREEIQLLRVFIRRLMDPSTLDDPQDEVSAYDRARALHLALRTLAHLLLVDQQLSGRDYRSAEKKQPDPP